MTVKGLEFLNGGGEASRLIVERDWTGHPLGAPEHWPDALKSALSLILNSPESMILAWGPELSFFFNETYFPLLGPRLSWAMGARFDKVWADGWDQAKPIIDDALAGRPRRFVDLPWDLGTDRGSQSTWWTFSYSRVLNAHGAVAGLFIFTNETTARVLADAALRESSERLRLVIEGAKDHVILTTDPDGIITEWSGGAEAILGWSAAEAIGQPVSILYSAEDRARSVDEDELSTASREGAADDKRWHVTKSGARVFLNGSVHPLALDEQGKARGFIKVARDETERRYADQKLARETERQRLSLQQMPGFAAVLSGPSHVFDYVNDAYKVIAGGRPLIGLPMCEAFPELVDQGFYDLLDQVYTSGERFVARSLAVKLSGENGDRHIDLLYQPVRNDEGQVTGIFVGGYDVTEQVRAERGLAEANAMLEQRVAEALQARESVEDALRQAQKMEAIGQLTGGVAHDFNNLLTVITGSVELLRRPDLSDERRARYIDAIGDTADRATKLTKQLLAFARRQTLKPELFDVGVSIDQVSNMVRTLAGARVEVKLALPREKLFVFADRSQLDTAIVNMAINARDAMNAEGLLTITAGAASEIPARRSHGAIAGEFVAITVSDTGTGIAEDHIIRIFEPFFTTKAVGQGTGLGLSQVIGFAKQSGGDVHVDSASGEGATFTLYLPRADATKDVANDEAPQTAVNGSGVCVLVVEDNLDVGAFAASALSELGYDCVLAASAEDALIELDKGCGRFHVVFSDVVMPGMGGLEFSKRVRRDYPDIPIVLTSGYSHVLAQNSEHGYELLHKPYSIEQLGRALGHAISTLTGIKVID